MIMFGTQGSTTTSPHFGTGNLAVLWRHPDIGFLLAAIGILFGIWLSNGVQEWRRKWLKLMKISSELPGPPALPIIGNALHFFCKPEDLLAKTVDMCKRYDAPFRFWMGPKLLVVLTEPRDIEVILNSSSAAYKSSIYRFMESFIGQGLISGSGPSQRMHRKMIMPMLNTKILDMYVDYFDARSRCCAECMKDQVDAGEFDVYSFMEHCTVDIILDTIMGIPGTSQKGGYKQLIENCRRMYELIHARMMKAWLHPNWIYAHSKYNEQQEVAENVIHEFTENLIARKKKEHYALERGSVISERPRIMLLEQLIAHNEKSNVMSNSELRDEMFTLYLAAQDTSATISSFVFLMLGMHPEIQDKVREELFEVLEDRHVTAGDLCKLKYLESVIKETIRLFPIAPLMARELKEDVQLESCTLPEGCSVVLVAYMTHRDPKYWTNPDKFDPDRFKPENSKERHNYAYVPFSGGPRGCIGQKYAMMCLKTIIANIVRRYRICCNGTIDKLRLKTDISIRPMDGYKISITRI